MKAGGFAAIASAVVFFTACGPPRPAATGKVGSSIALLADGRLAVVNPDQGSISFVNRDSLETSGTIEVGEEPKALLQLQSGTLLVATHRGGEVVAINPTTSAVVARRSICQGPAGLAESADHTWVAATCEWSGTLLRIDPVTFDSTVLASDLRRPRGVVIAGNVAIVTEFLGGQVVRVRKGKADRVSLVPTMAAYRPALTRMTANLGAAIVPAFDHLFVAHELVNHTGDDPSENTADDYGTVRNGTPKINAAVTRLMLAGEDVSAPPETPPVYSRFDTSAHAFSGATAIAPFGHRYLLVSHLATNDVAVLDTTATDPNKRLVATYDVGNGPSGIAVDEAHSVAYVDNFFDGSVSRLDLTLEKNESAPRHRSALTRIRGLPSPYSADATDGRKLFNDATNPHVTPSRVVACASCHPSGGDDGLVWFMQTPQISLKRRRTPHLANARSETAPFHWNAEFPTMTDLVNHTVTDLMAGDGLLVEGAKVQAYIDEIVKAPIAPPQDAATVARGELLFREKAGCAGCHTGSAQTDLQRHAVLSPASMTADDTFVDADTPALHGLFFRAPFFHDGRASDLHDLLTRPDAAQHGNTSGLNAGELDDLIAYLKTL